MKIMKMYFVSPLWIASTAIILMGCHNTKEEQQVKTLSVKVTLQTIQTVSQPQTFLYSGSIEADNIAQVGFAVPGTVNGIVVQEGQHVNKGQLLASIDATEYVNALAIANAGLEQAQDMYNRLDALYKKGSLPEKEYIDIKTKLAQAKANKAINAKHIADSKLYSPMTGIISARLIERGSTAAPGVPAFTIIKTDRVYAKVSVPESEIGLLKVGTRADVFVTTLNQTFKGAVTIINPMADAVSKTYSVKILLNNSDGKLLPGMLTNVTISTGKSVNAIIIPSSCVVRDADDLTYVFVEQNNKAIRKRITVSTITGNNDVIVSSGLQVGDKIIVAGQSHLKDGTAIVF